MVTCVPKSTQNSDQACAHGSKPRPCRRHTQGSGRSQIPGTNRFCREIRSGASFFRAASESKNPPPNYARYRVFSITSRPTVLKTTHSTRCAHPRQSKAHGSDSTLPLLFSYSLGIGSCSKWALILTTAALTFAFRRRTPDEQPSDLGGTTPLTSRLPGRAG